MFESRNVAAPLGHWAMLVQLGPMSLTASWRPEGS
jgi:hypothetical protein